MLSIKTKFLFLLLALFCSRVPNLLCQESIAKDVGVAITVEDYCSYLNATAASNLNDLYDERMPGALIMRTGLPGSYCYNLVSSASTDRFNSCITGLSLDDVERYCNWLNNAASTSTYNLNNCAIGAAHVDHSLKSNQLTFQLVSTEASAYQAGGPEIAGAAGTEEVGAEVAATLAWIVSMVEGGARRPETIRTEDLSSRTLPPLTKMRLGEPISSEAERERSYARISHKREELDAKVAEARAEQTKASHAQDHRDSSKFARITTILKDATRICSEAYKATRDQVPQATELYFKAIEANRQQARALEESSEELLVERYQKASDAYFTAACSHRYAAQAGKMERPLAAERYQKRAAAEEEQAKAFERGDEKEAQLYQKSSDALTQALNYYMKVEDSWPYYDEAKRKQDVQVAALYVQASEAWENRDERGGTRAFFEAAYFEDPGSYEKDFLAKRDQQSFTREAYFAKAKEVLLSGDQEGSSRWKNAGEAIDESETQLELSIFYNQKTIHQENKNRPTLVNLFKDAAAQAKITSDSLNKYATALANQRENALELEQKAIHEKTRTWELEKRIKKEEEHLKKEEEESARSFEERELGTPVALRGKIRNFPDIASGSPAKLSSKAVVADHHHFQNASEFLTEEEKEIVEAAIIKIVARKENGTTKQEESIPQDSIYGSILSPTEGSSKKSESNVQPDLNDRDALLSIEDHVIMIETIRESFEKKDESFEKKDKIRKKKRVKVKLSRYVDKNALKFESGITTPISKREKGLKEKNLSNRSIPKPKPNNSIKEAEAVRPPVDSLEIETWFGWATKLVNNASRNTEVSDISSLVAKIAFTGRNYPTWAAKKACLAWKERLKKTDESIKLLENKKESIIKNREEEINKFHENINNLQKAYGSAQQSLQASLDAKNAGEQQWREVKKSPKAKKTKGDNKDLSKFKQDHALAQQEVNTRKSAIQKAREELIDKIIQYRTNYHELDQRINELENSSISDKEVWRSIFAPIVKWTNASDAWNEATDFSRRAWDAKVKAINTQEELPEVIKAASYWEKACEAKKEAFKNENDLIRKACLNADAAWADAKKKTWLVREARNKANRNILPWEEVIEKEKEAEDAWSIAQGAKQQAHDLIRESNCLKSRLYIEMILAEALKVDRIARIAEIKARCQDATLENDINFQQAWEEAINKTKEAEKAWEEFINNYQSLNINSFQIDKVEWNDNLAKAKYWKIASHIQPFWLKAEKAKKILDARKSQLHIKNIESVEIKRKALNWNDACLDLVNAYNFNDREALAPAQQLEWDNSFKKAQQLHLESNVELAHFSNVQKVKADSSKVSFKPLIPINEEALEIPMPFSGFEENTTASSEDNIDEKLKGNKPLSNLQSRESLNALSVSDSEGRTTLDAYDPFSTRKRSGSKSSSTVDTIPPKMEREVSFTSLSEKNTECFDNNIDSIDLLLGNKEESGALVNKRSFKEDELQWGVLYDEAEAISELAYDLQRKAEETQDATTALTLWQEAWQKAIETKVAYHHSLTAIPGDDQILPEFKNYWKENFEVTKNNEAIWNTYIYLFGMKIVESKISIKLNDAKAADQTNLKEAVLLWGELVEKAKTLEDAIEDFEKHDRAGREESPPYLKEQWPIDSEDINHAKRTLKAFTVWYQAKSLASIAKVNISDAENDASLEHWNQVIENISKVEEAYDRTILAFKEAQAQDPEELKNDWVERIEEAEDRKLHWAAKLLEEEAKKAKHYALVAQNKANASDSKEILRKAKNKIAKATTQFTEALRAFEEGYDKAPTRLKGWWDNKIKIIRDKIRELEAAGNVSQFGKSGLEKSEEESIGGIVAASSLNKEADQPSSSLLEENPEQQTPLQKPATSVPLERERLGFYRVDEIQQHIRDILRRAAARNQEIEVIPITKAKRKDWSVDLETEKAMTLAQALQPPLDSTQLFNWQAWAEAIIRQSNYLPVDSSLKDLIAQYGAAHSEWVDDEFKAAWALRMKESAVMERKTSNNHRRLNRREIFAEADQRALEAIITGELFESKKNNRMRAVKRSNKVREATLRAKAEFTVIEFIWSDFLKAKKLFEQDKNVENLRRAIDAAYAVCDEVVVGGYTAAVADAYAAAEVAADALATAACAAVYATTDDLIAAFSAADDAFATVARASDHAKHAVNTPLEKEAQWAVMAAQEAADFARAVCNFYDAQKRIKETKEVTVDVSASKPTSEELDLSQKIEQQEQQIASYQQQMVEADITKNQEAKDRLQKALQFNQGSLQRLKELEQVASWKIKFFEAAAGQPRHDITTFWDSIVAQNNSLVRQYQQGAAAFEQANQAEMKNWEKAFYHLEESAHWVTQAVFHMIKAMEAENNSCSDLVTCYQKTAIQNLLTAQQWSHLVVATVAVGSENIAHLEKLHEEAIAHNRSSYELKKKQDAERQKITALQVKGGLLDPKKMLGEEENQKAQLASPLILSENSPYEITLEEELLGEKLLSSLVVPATFVADSVPRENIFHTLGLQSSAGKVSASALGGKLNEEELLKDQKEENQGVSAARRRCREAFESQIEALIVGDESAAEMYGKIVLAEWSAAEAFKNSAENEKESNHEAAEAWLKCAKAFKKQVEALIERDKDTAQDCEDIALGQESFALTYEAITKKKKEINYKADENWRRDIEVLAQKVKGIIEIHRKKLKAAQRDIAEAFKNSAKSEQDRNHEASAAWHKCVEAFKKQIAALIEGDESAAKMSQQIAKIQRRVAWAYENTVRNEKVGNHEAAAADRKLAAAYEKQVDALALSDKEAIQLYEKIINALNQASEFYALAYSGFAECAGIKVDRGDYYKIAVLYDQAAEAWENGNERAAMHILLKATYLEDPSSFKQELEIKIENQFSREDQYRKQAEEALASGNQEEATRWNAAVDAVHESTMTWLYCSIGYASKVTTTEATPALVNLFKEATTQARTVADSLNEYAAALANRAENTLELEQTAIHEKARAWDLEKQIKEEKKERALQPEKGRLKKLEEGLSRGEVAVSLLEKEPDQPSLSETNPNRPYVQVLLQESAEVPEGEKPFSAKNVQKTKEGKRNFSASSFNVTSSQYLLSETIDKFGALIEAGKLELKALTQKKSQGGRRKVLRRGDKTEELERQNREAKELQLEVLTQKDQDAASLHEQKANAAPFVDFSSCLFADIEILKNQFKGLQKVGRDFMASSESFITEKADRDQPDKVTKAAEVLLKEAHTTYNSSWRLDRDASDIAWTLVSAAEAAISKAPIAAELAFEAAKKCCEEVEDYWREEAVFVREIAQTTVLFVKGYKAHEKGHFKKEGEEKPVAFQFQRKALQDEEDVLDDDQSSTVTEVMPEEKKKEEVLFADFPSYLRADVEILKEQLKELQEKGRDFIDCSESFRERANRDQSDKVTKAAEVLLKEAHTTYDSSWRLDKDASDIAWTLVSAAEAAISKAPIAAELAFEAAEKCCDEVEDYWREEAAFAQGIAQATVLFIKDYKAYKKEHPEIEQKTKKRASLPKQPEGAYAWRAPLAFASVMMGLGVFSDIYLMNQGVCSWHAKRIEPLFSNQSSSFADQTREWLRCPKILDAEETAHEAWPEIIQQQKKYQTTFDQVEDPQKGPKVDSARSAEEL